MVIGGCTHKTIVAKPTKATVLAPTPLGILLGCSRHQQGFTEEECGEMWNWEIVINE
jgi:hypothetical protein